MYNSDLPKLLNDNLSESRRINLNDPKNFNKTITNLIKSNSKLNHIITRYKEHEIRANLLRKTKDNLDNTKNRTSDLNYDYYRCNYSNWVEGIKNNLIEKDKMRSTSNNLNSTMVIDSSTQKLKSKSNNNGDKRKHSWSNFNVSIQKNNEEIKVGAMKNEVKSRESKNEDDVEYEEKNKIEVNNNSNYTFWKFNNEENDSLLRKIYDKKLIIDLKLVKDAHTEHLEKLKCKTENNAPNMKYIKEKIDKTKQKILFIKGIVDYAYPNIMIEKAKSLDILKRSKSKTNKISLTNNKESINKNHKFFMTKSTSAFYSTNLFKSLERRSSNSFNPKQGILRKTFSSPKINLKEGNRFPNKKVKVYNPINIHSFTPGFLNNINIV